MPFEIRLPELSASMTEADLIAWLVKPGDRVRAGDVIAEIETDKSTVELEAEVAGTVRELLVAEGTTEVPVGAVLALIDADEPVGDAARDAGPPEGAAPSERAKESPGEEAPRPAAVEAPEAPAEAPGETAPAPRATPRRAGRPGATALARRIADQEGVDLADVRGSGAGGRITKLDVTRALERTAPEAAEPAAPASADRSAPEGEASADALEAPFERVPLTRMRRTIARRLSEAKQSIPHFYLRVECEVDRLLEVRRRLNDRDDGTRISVNDFFVRALALSLLEVPEANVAWDEDAIRRFRRVDVSVAVATEGGLVTPVVRSADRKGLREIADEVRELAERAREGRLAPEQYRGGTFSVSNLGMYGIESVYPILNPPQAGILGVGAALPRPVVRDGALVAGTVVACTLSADHRALDGAVGARLLAALKRRVEDPLAMLL